MPDEKPTPIFDFSNERATVRSKLPVLATPLGSRLERFIGSIPEKKVEQLRIAKAVSRAIAHITEKGEHWKLLFLLDEKDLAFTDQYESSVWRLIEERDLTEANILRMNTTLTELAYNDWEERPDGSINLSTPPEGLVATAGVFHQCWMEDLVELTNTGLTVLPLNGRHSMGNEDIIQRRGVALLWDIEKD